MEGESVEGNSLAAADMPEHLSQRMEGESIEGNSLAADMPELNKSTKAAHKAHSENKNKQVAKPELESQEDTCKEYFNLSDFEADDFYEIQPEIYSPTSMGGNESD
ncbi:hypothetical protein P8452_41649 [Trifolium repens]|nr:hypothetical protein P8452_41649 [Trifolium repens]